MIRVHALVFVTLLELIVVFAALWLGWFLKARTLNRRLAALRAMPADAPTDRGESAYFSNELIATRAHIDARTKEDPDAPLTGLMLRAAYLDIERDLAQGQQRDAAFWDQARQQLGALLEAYAPAAPQPATPAVADNPDETTAADADSVDSPDDKPPPGTQSSVLEEFRTALGELLADQQQNPEMRVHADRLMRCSRELAMCLSVLEDDNGFLREKLKEAGIRHDE